VILDQDINAIGNQVIGYWFQATVVPSIIDNKTPR
jgi:hypothetical protein